MFQVQRGDDATTRVITGLKVIRFGVPIIGVYANTGRRRVPISPAVPGAQYKITAWALGDGRRSTTPAVEYVTLKEASELPLCTATYVCMLTQSSSTLCHCFQAITCCIGYATYYSY